MIHEPMNLLDGKPRISRKPRTRKVYRVENYRGGGPYRCKHDIHFAHFSADTHPTHIEDKGLNFTRDDNINAYRFGFISLAQLKKWFDAEDRSELFLGKFQVTVYDVTYDAVKASDKQAMFKRKDSRKRQVIKFKSNGDLIVSI